MAKQEAESLRKHLSALSTRLEAAERTASDAKNLATKAMENHVRAASAATSLEHRLQSTTQRVNDQEDKSKVRAWSLPSFCYIWGCSVAACHLSLL
jgi:hypothetical protein